MNPRSIAFGTSPGIDLFPSIEFAHMMVHMGRLYYLGFENTDLDIGEVMLGAIVVGSKPLHTVLRAEATGQVLVEMYKGPTIAALGTELSTFNFNETKSDSGLLSKFYSGTTLTGDARGTKRFARRIKGNTQGNSVISSEMREGAERILAPNTTYLLRTEGFTDNALFSFDAVLYEEEI